MRLLRSKPPSVMIRGQIDLAPEARGSARWPRSFQFGFFLISLYHRPDVC
jgi:hypothetical protein